MSHLVEYSHDGHSIEVINNLKNIPPELRRIIIRFIPRSKTAKIIHNSLSNIISLKYVRIYKFSDTEVWNDLKPSTLQTVFYGDKKHIIRRDISRGERLRLMKYGIIPNGTILW